MNKLIPSLSCLALLFIINCDNEQPNPPPSFKKAMATLSFMDSIGILDFLGFEYIKKLKLTISTDEKGSTPAKYYKDMNDPTGKDIKDIIYPVKENEIQVLLDVTKEGKDYYIQTFSLIDDDENIVYKLAQIPTKFTLKTFDDHTIRVNLVKPWDGTAKRAAPEFSVASVEDNAFLIEFQNCKNHYFNATANIDLKLLYDDKILLNFTDIFSPYKGDSINQLKLVLPDKRSSYIAEKFTIEAKVHDYPEKGVTHDFAIPADVGEQIKKGNLFLRVLNHDPEVSVNNGSDLININLSKAKPIINIPFNIIDEDNDEIYQILCLLFKIEKNDDLKYIGILNEFNGYIDIKTFKQGINNISFSRNKLTTEEGKLIIQENLKNYLISIWFILYDKLYFSTEIKAQIYINQKPTH